MEAQQRFWCMHVYVMYDSASHLASVAVLVRGKVLACERMA
jgi:hypothetical protein